MFETVFKELLTCYLGEFVDLSRHEFDFGLLQGEIALRNVDLRSDGIRKLGLPVVLREGRLKQLTVSIPWTHVTTEPIVIRVSGAVLSVSSRTSLSNADVQEVKREQLEDFERLVLSRIQGHRFGEGLEKRLQKKNQKTTTARERATDAQPLREQGESETSTIVNIVTRILNNIMIEVSDVRIEWEDTVSRPIPFAIGFSLEKFTLRRGDVLGDESAGSTFQKQIELRGLCVYRDQREVASDTGVVRAKDDDEGNSSGEGFLFDLEESEGRSYILKPLTISANIEGTLGQAMRVALDVAFKEVRVSLKEEHVGDLFVLTQYTSQHAILLHVKNRWWYRVFRPTRSPKHSPRAWWLFAVRCLVWWRRDSKGYTSSQYITHRRSDRLKYMHMYSQMLSREPLTTRRLDAIRANRPLARLESRLSYRDVAYFRFLVHAHYTRAARSGRIPEGWWAWIQQLLPSAQHQRDGWELSESGKNPDLGGLSSDEIHILRALLRGSDSSPEEDVEDAVHEVEDREETALADAEKAISGSEAADFERTLIRLPNIRLHLTVPSVKLDVLASESSRASRLCELKQKDGDKIMSLAVRGIAVRLGTGGQTTLALQSKGAVIHPIEAGQKQPTQPPRGDSSEKPLPNKLTSGLAAFGFGLTVQSVSLVDHFTPGSLYRAVLGRSTGKDPAGVPVSTEELSADIRLQVCARVGGGLIVEDPKAEGASKMQPLQPTVSVWTRVQPLLLQVNPIFLVRVASVFSEENYLFNIANLYPTNTVLVQSVDDIIPAPDVVLNEGILRQLYRRRSLILLLDVLLDQPRIIIASALDAPDSPALHLSVSQFRLSSSTLLGSLCKTLSHWQPADPAPDLPQDEEVFPPLHPATVLRSLLYEDHTLMLKDVSVGALRATGGKWWFEDGWVGEDQELSIVDKYDWSVLLQRAIVTHPLVSPIRIVGDLPHVNINLALSNLAIALDVVAFILTDPPWVRGPANTTVVPKKYTRDEKNANKFLKQVLNKPSVEVHMSVEALTVNIFSKHRFTPPEAKNIEPKMLSATLYGAILELGVRDMDQYVTAAVGGLHVIGKLLCVDNYRDNSLSLKGGLLSCSLAWITFASPMTLQLTR